MSDQRASGSERAGGHADGGMSPNQFLKKPLYQQLRDVLAERISEGTWKPGAAIPNETELAREFGVSAGTMRKALDLMEMDRLLTRRQGRGTFVNDQASDDLALRFSALRGADGLHLESEARTIKVAESAPSERERQRLQLGPNERIFRIDHLCLHNDEPFMVRRAVVPAALFPGLDRQAAVASRIRTLAQQYGVLIGKAEECISIAQASPEVADALRVAAGTPLMLLNRIAFALDGRPVEWRQAWCHLRDKFYKAEMT
jgi:GntR family transcriptional regulator